MFHALVAGFAATRFQGRSPALVFTSHLNDYAPLRSLVTRALKPWRAADIIFAEGQHAHLNARETYLIPNGVAVPTTAPTRAAWGESGPIRLLAVGRIADQKDPLGMLHAFKAAEIPGATLDFIGDGPLMPQAVALAGELGLSDRVIFHGVRSDVGTFLRQADIFVMHSKYEGMPIALLEAAAQAMPVLATPVGAVGDVLAEHCGVLATPEAFPAALAKLCAEPARALALGRALHARALETYSIDATTAAHEAIYERAARR
jgi:glycosyltransferase involved in cell wall biosynthesis